LERCRSRLMLTKWNVRGVISLFIRLNPVRSVFFKEILLAFLGFGTWRTHGVTGVGDQKIGVERFSFSDCAKRFINDLRMA